MATVILGGGIIGLGIAYYLSLERPPSDPAHQPITIVDSSPELLLSASGFAGGFLAEDWFSPQSASLGALSFKLHRELANQHGGHKRWGYAGTHTYSLSISNTGVAKRPKNNPNQDWLSSGTSRANVAPDSSSSTSTDEPLNPDGTPRCFTTQPGGTLSTLSTPESTAQIEPRELCSFLLSECESRGVRVLLSAHARSISVDTTNTLRGVDLTLTQPTGQDTHIPCTKLILAAGAWTPTLFQTLFPTSHLRIPIHPLAGYSLLASSPRYTAPFPLNTSAAQGQHMCYAVYSGPGPHWPYAPEAFARLGARGRPEIWIGGLNDPELALPATAQEVAALRDPEAVGELRRGFVQMCGRATVSGQEGEGVNEDDLHTLREGLCFRPVSDTGVPVIGRLRERQLGGVKTGEEGTGGGVFVAAGHGPWGISLSLGTGKVVAEMVLGSELSADVGMLGLR